ncbi:ferritin-like domain-containing protein [Granulicella sibirica]|nr:ferritin-like domain-containing protein [Granulicella sibirica]
MEDIGIETTEAALNEMRERKRSRRAAIGAGVAAIAGFAFGAGRPAEAQTAVSDFDILNFALNLEYLEAQYYTLAYQGVTIDKVGIGITGPGGAPGGAIIVRSNPIVPFTTPLLKQFASEVAAEEAIHVTFLRTALGSAAVAQPEIDLMNSFSALASAAGLGSGFDPFASELNFLLGAFVFEDVGVSAYLGAVGLITAPPYLDAAVGLLGTEGYHSATIRSRVFALGAAAQQAATAISATRAKLDGTGNDDVGLGVTSSGASTIACADANGLAFARSTAQVLGIVYGGGTGKGAFFPGGLNGNIR